MSSRQYSVIIKLKDDGILKKLEGVSGSSGSGGGAVRSGGGDVFRKIESLGVGQLLKLTGIGIGIGSLVALTTKSSAALQGTLKLWEHGMLLIFKPIGDFIGLALRPFALMMLQAAIPFYKWAGPLFRDYATKIGEFFNDPSAALATLATAIGGAVATAFLTRPPATPVSPSVSPGTIEGKCIELCDKNFPKFSSPIRDGVKDGIGNSAIVSTLVGIGTAGAGTAATVLLINSTLLDLKTDVRLMKESLNNLLNKFPSAAGVGGKSFNVNLAESLKISDIVGQEVFEGIKTDWGTVATTAGAAAAAGALAAHYIENAATVLGGAVSRLQGFAMSIPNQFSWGFAEFGNGRIVPSAGGSRMRTSMAGMADAVSV